jgi:NAD(P)-dependent dehydrogenase (short-subunit alcohol dehydrogenase family)
LLAKESVGAAGLAGLVNNAGIGVSGPVEYLPLKDALRMELRPWGLHVCLVEPATIATPAADKVQAASEALIAQLPRDGAQRYAGLFRTFTQRVVEREADGSPPEVVAAQVLRALMAARPQIRYLAGKNATRLSLLAWLMPERLLDQAPAPGRTLKV